MSTTQIEMSTSQMAHTGGKVYALTRPRTSLIGTLFTTYQATTLARRQARIHMRGQRRLRRLPSSPAPPADGAHKAVGGGGGSGAGRPGCRRACWHRKRRAAGQVYQLWLVHLLRVRLPLLPLLLLLP